MSATRTALLEAASHLFLAQGFAKTTVQQLAAEVGISKGAFYLHFRSKSDLLVHLMNKIGEDMLEGVLAIGSREDLDAMEKLREQIRYQFRDVLEHQKLLEMYLNDASVSLDEELVLFSQKMRADWQQVQSDFLREAFPDHSDKFTDDLSVILNGVLNEYHTYGLLEQLEIDADRLADLVCLVITGTIEQLRNATIEPVLEAGHLPSSEELAAQLESRRMSRIHKALEEIERYAAESSSEASSDSPGPDQSAATELLGIVNALRDLLAQEEPNAILLQSLVTSLREFKEIAAQRETLATELELRLV